MVQHGTSHVEPDVKQNSGAAILNGVEASALTLRAGSECRGKTEQSSRAAETGEPGHHSDLLVWTNRANFSYMC